MATKTTKFDAADYIDTPEDVIANICLLYTSDAADE